MQRSPFTAMSPREQQERWLEFQSIRLPYCRCACEQDACTERATEQSKPSGRELAENAESLSQQENGQHCGKGSRCGDCTGEHTKPENCECTCKEKQHHEVPQPPRECMVKLRHRQYDAVIERMNAACRNAYPYRSTSD